VLQGGNNNAVVSKFGHRKKRGKNFRLRMGDYIVNFTWWGGTKTQRKGLKKSALAETPGKKRGQGRSKKESLVKPNERNGLDLRFTRAKDKGSVVYYNA